MRLLAVFCLTLASVSAAEPDLGPALAATDLNERYRLALAVLRASENPATFARHADLRIAEAAIDASRERLADVTTNPSPEAGRLADELIAFAGAGGDAKPLLAMRAVHAVAESHNAFGGRISAAMAQLALNPGCAVRLDAIAALSELGDGSQAATLARLAGDSDTAVAEAARAALVEIQGKGVTDTFIRGIADPTLGDQARVALLQAATKRGLTSAAPAAIKILGETSLRLEAQKAVLKLARKTHLSELRDAREKLGDAPATQAALDRLIAKLSKE